MKRYSFSQKRLKYSYKEKIPKQVEYMRHLISDENSACLYELQFPRRVFLKLCTVLQKKVNLKPTKYVEVLEMVAVFLGILAQDKKTGKQKHDFMRSTWTVSRHFITVLTTVLSLQDGLYVKSKPIIENEISRFRFFENLSWCN